MKLVFQSFVIRISIILCLICFFTSNAQRSSYKPRRKLVGVWAEKIIEYFDLDKKLIADDYFENNEKSISTNESSKCDNLDSINNYFFYSYSGQHRNMTQEQLENIISHHVTRAPRDSYTEVRSKRSICKRKQVKCFSKTKRILLERIFCFKYIFKCLQSDEILRMAKINTSTINSVEEFQKLCPAMLYNFELGNCEYIGNSKGLPVDQSM
jgi:hypothetical protein